LVMFPAAFWETGLGPDAQPESSAASSTTKIIRRGFTTNAGASIQ